METAERHPNRQMTIEDLIENFEFFDDWEDRYAYLIELGRKMPPMDATEKIEENRVQGCQSRVWLKETVQDTRPPRIGFFADSDSQIVKGLLAVLRLMYAGHTPEEILTLDAHAVFKQLGLDRHLSPTRSTGLQALVKKIRGLATLYARARPAFLTSNTEGPDRTGQS